MPGPRSQARRYALLAIYQWQIGKQSAAEVIQHFYDDPLWMDAVSRGLVGYTDDDPLPKSLTFDVQLFDELFKGVTANSDDLDKVLRPFLDRSPMSIDPVELAILRLAAFELGYSPHIPSPVILDEAIDLAKTFGAEQGHRFINGVLDRIAQNRNSRI